jgi:Signal peptidase (SPase) II
MARMESAARISRVRKQRSERLLLMVVPAVLLAAADLVVKASVASLPWDVHQRSTAWVALSLFVLVALLALAFVPSRGVAVAAGVMMGGVLGNLISARLDGNRVPNPLLLGDHVNGIAFNLADVFVLSGNVLLVVTLMVVTIRNRHRLIPPRAWEHELRRRLRS